jgi:hypothetical protein
VPHCARVNAVVVGTWLDRARDLPGFHPLPMLPLSLTLLPSSTARWPVSPPRRAYRQTGACASGRGLAFCFLTLCCHPWATCTPAGAAGGLERRRLQDRHTRGH